MGKNGDNNDFVELGEYELSRVKNGLDEAQVTSCINELIRQLDELKQHEEHFSSLTKLAERTVTEADKLAEDIKIEAKEKARTEAREIIAKAEEQAKQRSEEKRTEIIDMATEQAEAIKTEAKREAKSLLENQRKKIKVELSNWGHQLYSHLSSELDNLKKQVAGLDEEFEHKLSDPVDVTNPVTIEQDERSDEFKELIQKTEARESTGEPDWEVEILPPIDITKIMGVVTHLDSLPEVNSTEIIPNADSPSIMVFLSEPINLTDVMKKIPEVGQVKEDTADASGDDIEPRKVQIVLLEETVLDETKERQNKGVSNILGILGI